MERKEFELAMRHEFELLEKNPPRTATGLISWLMEKAGWGNNPCVGKRIGATFDVLIDSAAFVAGLAGEIPTAGASTALTVYGASNVATDLYDCIEAYGPCD